MPVDINEMNSPDVITEALQGQGITPEYLAKKLKRELNAKETKVFYDRKTGEVVYSKKLVAWEIRQRARQDAHKLLGHYPATRHEVAGKDGEPITFILNMGGRQDANTEEERKQE